MPILPAAALRLLAARGAAAAGRQVVRGMAVVATVPKDQVPTAASGGKDRIVVQDTKRDEPVLVALVGDKLYAVEATCPHMNKSLEQGKILTGDGDAAPEIRCRFHNTRFNLSNGACTKWVTGALGFDNSIVGGLAQKVGGTKRDLRAYKVIVSPEDGSLTLDDEA